MRKVNHEDTICSNCGSNYTNSCWFRTHNIDGSWDTGRYHCAMCHTYFNRDTGKFSRIPEGKKVGGHKDTVCYDCGSNSASVWYKKRDKDEIWNGKYICAACYSNPAYKLRELNPNSSTYKGMIGVQTVAKVLGGKDCTIMKEGSPFDICSIQSLKYGKIEVKTATYNSKCMCWMIGGIRPGLFDTLFIVCTDNKFKNIFGIYIIDGIEVDNIKTITIYKNHLEYGWYKEFRVSDIVPYQEVFQTVKNDSQISRNYVDRGQNSMSNKEKGDICEEIVKIAINAKTSTDIRYDLVHEVYKRIEVKGSDYISRRKYWLVGNIKSYKFDILFIVCMNDNFKEIERIYIIPKEYVNVRVITIYRNLLYSGWYEKFRIEDIKSYQEACEKIMKNRVC